jgi:hypothetical protein
MHAWLWERGWGKAVVAGPIVALLGLLLVYAVRDQRRGGELKAGFAAVCIAEHDAAACEQALGANHMTCFNLSAYGGRGEQTRHDAGDYNKCMSRRMRGLSAREPRPRAE